MISRKFHAISMISVQFENISDSESLFFQVISNFRQHFSTRTIKRAAKRSSFSKM